MILFGFELSYLDEVENDVQSATLWYYEQNPNIQLEERFADAIKEVILKLQKNPFIYYPRFKNVRVAHPKFFPYGVHFIIDESKKQIIIVAILHNKQDLNNIEKRM